MNRQKELIEKLSEFHSLTLSEYETLITGYDEETFYFAREKANYFRRLYYGNKIFIRGLVEISNICGNDCYYCGIRKSDTNLERYKLSRDEILNCCKIGYDLGFRTFVFQSGESRIYSVKEICDIIGTVKSNFSDCALTLSLGEYPLSDYKAMYSAGADRYLLRHETADKAHYEKLHPEKMSFYNRMQCLKNLKETGFQTGCGFMVGSPFQTTKTLAKDLKFIEEFSPEMCGIGPFIPHKHTPFKDFSAGDCRLTLYLLSLIRIIKPNILLPSTTALNTLMKDGCAEGMLSGANVVMPNLSPLSARKKYTLYDNKRISGDEAGEELAVLKANMKKIGFEVISARGDINFEKGSYRTDNI